MEINHLPIIDWELGTKLAGNRRELAEEMMTMLLKNLNKDVTHISQLHFEKNYSELLLKVHKLHGALCYCGLPRLKAIVGHLERELKNNIMFDLPSLLQQLETEVTLLLKHFPTS